MKFKLAEFSKQTIGIGECHEEVVAGKEGFIIGPNNEPGLKGRRAGRTVILWQKK